jgi:hypothetical protein
MAVINDPHGYTNVRDYDGKVIARVKNGERFIAETLWKTARPDDPKMASLSEVRNHGLHG